MLYTAPTTNTFLPTPSFSVFVSYRGYNMKLDDFQLWALQKFNFYRPGQPNWENRMWLGFFLPLRFYVKLIWKCQKLPFYYPFEQLWILNFWEFLSFSSMKFPKNQNSNPPKLLKWIFLISWSHPKLIFKIKAFIFSTL